MKRQKRETKKERRTRAAAETGYRGPVPSMPTPTIAAAFRTRIESIAKAVAKPLEVRTVAGAIGAARAAAELADTGLALALRATHERRACKAGCSFCCRGLRVDVSVPEIARIVDHARQSLDPQTLGHVEARAKENAVQTHGKETLQYPVRLPCALLSDVGECLVYSVRPVACRIEHSTSAEECKAGHDTSQLGVDTPISRIPELQMVGAQVMLGAMGGIEIATGDTVPCELQEALHIAFSTPDAISRWLNGEDAFAAARIDENEPAPQPFVQLRRQ